MIKISKIIITISFIAMHLYVHAQSVIRLDNSTISENELTQKIEELIKKGKVHGLTISILNKESVLYQKAFGSKNFEKGTPLQISDGFYGASFSKSVFAYIVMKLVDDGVIDLDKPLQEYLEKPLPDYKFKEVYEGYQNLKNDARYKKITARMCLSHTSGLPNWRYIGKTGINLNRELEIELDPGTFYSYSGEGIYLLHFVVEQITGRNLEELAQEYVFQPFGMDMTSYVWQDKFESIRANGHYKKKKVAPIQKRLVANAAGSMETTPQDFAKFMQAMLNKEGLSETSFKEMILPQIDIVSKQQFGSNRLVETDENRDIELSYGLGWGIYKTPHGKAVFKEGHIRGWEHYCIFYPDNNLSIVIMTNSSNGESIFKELLEITAADTWLPWYWENYFPYDN